MTITSDQCRAARGLLGWSQDKLAENARVSRATVTDFEANSRQPMKNNLSSIEDSLYAAGVDFVGESDGNGVGVRFRERKLQAAKTVKVDPYERSVQIRMDYAGVPFIATVPREVVEDYFRTNFRTENEVASAYSEMHHQVLAGVERYLKAGGSLEPQNAMLIVTEEMIKGKAVPVVTGRRRLQVRDRVKFRADTRARQEARVGADEVGVVTFVEQLPAALGTIFYNVQVLFEGRPQPLTRPGFEFEVVEEVGATGSD